MSPKLRCDICRGQGTVRLPVYHRMTALAMSGDIPTVQTEAYRAYPCPECADAVSIGQVQALSEITTADAQYADDPKFIEHINESMAHALVEKLIKDGYIRFERGLVDEKDWRFGASATLAVAHPSRLDTLELRISERQTEVARDVVNESIRQIDNWGSHYGHSEILKRDARRLIAESIQEVLKKRSPFDRDNSRRSACTSS